MLRYFFAVSISCRGVFCVFLMKPFVIIIFRPITKKYNTLAISLPIIVRSSNIPSSRGSEYGIRKVFQFFSSNSIIRDILARIFISVPSRNSVTGQSPLSVSKNSISNCSKYMHFLYGIYPIFIIFIFSCFVNTVR